MALDFSQMNRGISSGTSGSGSRSSSSGGLDFTAMNKGMTPQRPDQWKIQQENEASRIASEKANSFGGLLGNTLKGIPKATGIGDAFNAGVQQTKKGYGQTFGGESSLVQRGEGLLGMGAGAVNTAFSPLAPVFAPIGKGIEYAGDKLAETPYMQKVGRGLLEDPRGESNPERILQAVENASVIGGVFAPLKRPAPKRIPVQSAIDVPTKIPVKKTIPVKSAIPESTQVNVRTPYKAPNELPVIDYGRPAPRAVDALPDIELGAPLLAKPKKTVSQDALVAQDAPLKQRAPSEERASSVISYIDKDNQKVFTRLTKKELDSLKDEVRKIPEPTEGQSQIHLDADTKALQKAGREISRDEFIAGHSQAKAVLGTTKKETQVAKATTERKAAAKTEEAKTSKNVEKMKKEETKRSNKGVLTQALEEKKMQLEFAQEALDNDPAKGLLQFTAKTGQNKGTLQEVTGKAKGKFARSGDDIASELGFADSETARNAVLRYQEKKATLLQEKSELAGEIKAFREQTKEKKVTRSKVSTKTPKLAKKEPVLRKPAKAEDTRDITYEPIKESTLTQHKTDGAVNGSVGKAPLTKKAPPVLKKGTVTRTASNTNKELVKQGFKELPLEEQSKYTPTSFKKIANDIAKAMDEDITHVENVATGNAPIPKGWNAQIAFNAIEKRAIQAGDGEMLTRLAQSPVGKKLSEAAQQLGGHGFNDNPNSPVARIQEVQRARQKAVEKRIDVTKEKAQTVKEITETIKKTAPTKETWNSFLDSITC